MPARNLKNEFWFENARSSVSSSDDISDIPRVECFQRPVKSVLILVDEGSGSFRDG